MLLFCAKAGTDLVAAVVIAVSAAVRRSARFVSIKVIPIYKIAAAPIAALMRDNNEPPASAYGPSRRLPRRNGQVAIGVRADNEGPAAARNPMVGRYPRIM